MIRQFLEQEFVTKIWGSFVGPSWKDGSFTISHRDQLLQDPTILCGGIGSSMWTGKHPDIVIFDDVVTFRNTYTRAAVGKLWSQLGITMSGIEKTTTKTWWINTPYTTNDPIAQKIRAHKGESSREDPIPTLVLPAIQEISGREQSFWPEWLPLKSVTRNGKRVRGLLERKKRMNRQRIGSFEAQYLMDTSKLEELVFDAKNIRRIQRDEVPKGIEVYQFFDAAWSKRATRKSDYSAVATLGYDRKNETYILLRVRSCKGLESTKVMVLDEWETWKPRKIGIEKTSLYAREVDGFMADDRFSKINHEDWHIERPHENKKARAVPLQNLLELGRFFAVVEEKENWWTEFREQLEQFPTSQFDDMVDAVSQCVIMIQRYKRVKRSAAFGGQTSLSNYGHRTRRAL